MSILYSTISKISILLRPHLSPSQGGCTIKNFYIYLKIPFLDENKYDKLRCKFPCSANNFSKYGKSRKSYLVFLPVSRGFFPHAALCVVCTCSVFPYGFMPVLLAEHVQI
jgi:hypothetical protein